MMTAKLYQWSEESNLWRHVRDIQVDQEVAFKTVKGFREVFYFYKFEIHNKAGKLVVELNTINPSLFD